MLKAKIISSTIGRKEGHTLLPLNCNIIQDDQLDKKEKKRNPYVNEDVKLSLFSHDLTTYIKALWTTHTKTLPLINDTK